MRKRFTLIELLVCVAIIAMLAALLLPVLAKARYAAKNVLCMGNLRQVAAGWVAYAGDHDEFYPDYMPPYTQETPGFSYAYETAPGRQRSLIIAEKPNPASGKPGGDMRPQLREYLGPLNDIMVCPLAHDGWQSHKDDPDVDYGSWDIDGFNNTRYGQQTSYMLYTTGNASTKHFEQKKVSRKAGSYFVPNKGRAANKEFNLIASDVMWGNTYTELITSQRPYAGNATRFNSWINSANAWQIDVMVMTAANYARGDGSVTSYKRVQSTSILDGRFLNTFKETSPFGLYLPADLAGQ